MTKKEFFNETGGINGDDCSFQVLADKFDSICDLMKKYFGSHEFTSRKFYNIINSKEKINKVGKDYFIFIVESLYIETINSAMEVFLYHKNKKQVVEDYTKRIEFITTNMYI